MGRNSSTPKQGIAFGIGDTTKSFQMAGKHFELKDSLKMSASGIAKKSANVFKILTLGSFKPDDLLVFSSFNLFATDSHDTVGNDSVSLLINHLF